MVIMIQNAIIETKDKDDETILLTFKIYLIDTEIKILNKLVQRLIIFKYSFSWI